MATIDSTATPVDPDVGDRPVVFDHRGQVLGHRQAEPAQSVEVGLGALVDRPDRRVPAEVADLAVVGVVEQLPGVDVGAGDGAFLGAQVFLDLRHRLFVGEFGGDADSGALERLADELGVGDGLRADAGDEGADLGTDFDQAIVAETTESLADGRAADPEAVAQLGLREPFARRQLGPHNQIPQRRIQIRTRRPTPSSQLRGSTAADGYRLCHQKKY